MKLGPVFMVAMVLLAGCSGNRQKAPEKVCEVKGEVMRVDSQVRTASIKHGQICDWMEPMTMEFPVREQKDFDLLKPGAKITGKVHIGDPEFWLGSVALTN